MRTPSTLPSQARSKPEQRHATQRSKEVTPIAEEKRTDNLIEAMEGSNKNQHQILWNDKRATTGKEKGMSTSEQHECTRGKATVQHKMEEGKGNVNLQQNEETCIKEWEEDIGKQRGTPTNKRVKQANNRKSTAIIWEGSKQDQHYIMMIEKRNEQEFIPIAKEKRENHQEILTTKAEHGNHVIEIGSNSTWDTRRNKNDLKEQWSKSKQRSKGKKQTLINRKPSTVREDTAWLATKSTRLCGHSSMGISIASSIQHLISRRRRRNWEGMTNQRQQLDQEMLNGNKEIRNHHNVKRPENKRDATREQYPTKT